jgi:hypothetical protein
MSGVWCSSVRNHDRLAPHRGAASSSEKSRAPMTFRSTIDNPTADEPHNGVRGHLLRIWGEQACRCHKDWRRVLAELLTDSGAPEPSRFGRSSVAPLVDAAVAELARLFGDTPPDEARASDGAAQ